MNINIILKLLKSDSYLVAFMSAPISLNILYKQICCWFWYINIHQYNEQSRDDVVCVIYGKIADTNKIAFYHYVY